MRLFASGNFNRTFFDDYRKLEVHNYINPTVEKLVVIPTYNEKEGIV